MSSRVMSRPRARRRTSADTAPDATLFGPGFVRHLFNQMAPSYGWHQWMALGLTACWRRQAVQQLPALPPAGVVVDLMCGGGELWPALRRRLGPAAQLHGVDFAAAMLEQAARRQQSAAVHANTALHLADALRTPLPAAAADAVVCAYGLKTLETERLLDLAAEVRRLLRPGGACVLLEFTLPRQGWRRWAFRQYLGTVLPLLTWLSRGRAALHRYLPFYAHSFANLDAAEGALLAAGFAEVRQVPLLLGCATALVGVRRD
ncbi:class I SAM-dependent methyltransferase [Hymenobacter jeollabukensis]|uniref:Methyltransferase domain-containing protein n=1 Tax=Hymenobacter jeollabukensis TaxID=2025313 RepID=A0A5R8WP43_9BACT|nr:class I SAM-dependent methyltransferase [Hymenobacter jeollabukensis]TLM91847.1 methyltransferase domain-containing protein [Hymenobacter jeollabukensis]